MSSDDLYLGFDLSTQQLKAIAISSSLGVIYSAIVDFDKDTHGFDVTKGVLSNEIEHEVYAPIAMWLQALDVVLERLQGQGLDFGRVKGISGAGQQHGSVYWSHDHARVLTGLKPDQRVEQQLSLAFSYPYSPNWQDASTQTQCDLFDNILGNADQLAQITGSKAHHRFTGPQILRFQQKHPEEYAATGRISLVSSFLASIFLGQVAAIDIADVCGMNLWNIKKGDYDAMLLELAAGSSTAAADLRSKLGDVAVDGGKSLGSVGPYFVKRYGFDPACRIIPFTGDNPSTMLALPLRPLDAIVSLGTSTTFLMSTPMYKPDTAVHLMNHPTTPDLYMFMLCYKNGGLAREAIRDSLAETDRDSSTADVASDWDLFNQILLSSPPYNAKADQSPSTTLKLGLYFPRPEIVPNVPAGIHRYAYNTKTKAIDKSTTLWNLPDDDVRAILESQLLSLRLRSRNIVATPSPNPHALPPQPRRIYLVGGGSHNTAIARVVGEILGGTEGVYRLDMGANACALGGAHKAIWGCLRQPNESFESFISARWREEEFTKRIDEGYREASFARYAIGVEALETVEQDVLSNVSRS